MDNDKRDLQNKRCSAGGSPASKAMRGLVERLVGGQSDQSSGTQYVDASVYLDNERFVQERKALFSNLPVPVVLSARLGNGQSVTHDHYGVPLLITRDATGQVHVFFNVCRHRGTRLVQSSEVSAASRLVCPYHAWTYALDGKLLALPRPETFEGLDKSQYRLKAFSAVEAGGFVWTRLDGEQVETGSLLGNIEHDLDVLGLSDAHVFKSRTHRVKANWKLIMDAFLESYHVQRLHKHTIAPFFADAIATSQREGLHFRSVTARNGYEQARVTDSLDSLRLMLTFTYNLLPGTVVVVSPDYINVMMIYPQNNDQTLVEDYMLIAQPVTSDEEREHFTSSFELLDGGVFSGEDFRAAELAQQGLASGAIDRLTLGTAEHGVADFHQTLDELVNAVS